MRRLLISAAAAAMCGPVAAQDRNAPIECGGVYVVQRGDTLHRIAVRAYGPDATYRTLWRHNRASLGLRDPSQIEIGQGIEVPCLDAAGEPMPLTLPEPGTETADADPGPLPAAEVLAAAPAAPAETVAPAIPTPVVVALNDPTALSAHLGLAALRLEMGADGFTVDGGASPQAALHVGVAAPDCDASPEACAGALWSAPIFEQVAVVHARRALPQADDFRDLKGLRVCRAVGLPEHLLATRGVMASRAADAVTCLRDVAETRADVAVTPAPQADAALTDPALAAALSEQVALTILYDVKATGPADDPATARAISALDAGLARLRRTGAWFAAVDAALAAKTAP